MSDLETKLKDLNKRLRTTQSELRSAERSRDEYKKVADIVARLEDYDPSVPDIIRRPPDKVDFPGVPVLMLSDLHWGETVKPIEVRRVNGYNMAIAQARLKRVAETAVELFHTHLAHTEDYPGIVLLLGGDLISGEIHDELTRTNDADIMEQCRDCAEHLVGVVRLLAKEFPRVDIWSVPGNHGRTSRKPPMKSYSLTNFDWLISHMVAMTCSAMRLDNVHPHLSSAREVDIPIGKHTIHLMHGDQFKGGDGIIGPLGPITRGDVKKRYSSAMMPGKKGYDILALGHFHQATYQRRLIVNGSLKGYDEFALAQNFPWEPPIQMAWTVHPKYGVNWLMPILGGEFKRMWPKS